MTKADLVKTMAAKATEATDVKYSQKDAAALLDAAIETIVDSVKAGDSVKLAGFGTFELVERAEREGVNPQTKEKITIPATVAPKFKVSAAFKAAVRA